ncbi:hypothetical protein [Saccharothrix sp. ALI-22-I]|uniref:hypothetical protein n=1 Tax=Saccharothrix sp. ALI-22-I TaxID=1933778 RepID=UPI0015C2D00F|nr:hypothetical protein [Saccharothrix sp. ALI-22-I]
MEEHKAIVDDGRVLWAAELGQDWREEYRRNLATCRGSSRPDSFGWTVLAHLAR